ncbi:U3 snoRNP-associated protein Utp13 [Taphrina deformans PYCC 5710]|uniref:U3 snoRNP-associated protein Utp13 n=1 Tax=Taphrina deformans (strain PYCC 5710 / ATCC 11124 / CBS 356.35 / IMI 108563 / JCM 9778 / NBRC 8474) TaxID=1097556 RepID=R4XB74_TAPDE|nr:U3 snoRNP-associated protein Utp13 [Taphrina deformans PYCC 5710]|eukprot:CCG82855.1 U3 snoRNP-associated protein Utp13 [Taphrina deformans PYCC 5710]
MVPLPLKTSFAVEKEVDPLYSGGPVSIANGLLATTLVSQVQVSELATGKRIIKLEGDEEVITALNLTSDGQYLITCSRSLLMRTYEIPSGKIIRQVKAHESPVISIETDSTSTLVATGGAEGTVKVWDIRGGFVTHNFKGHGGVISALRFYGRAGSRTWRLASGADDCKIRVWDLVSSKCLATLDNHSSVIRGLDFSDDGNTLISGSRDQVLNTWDLKKFKLKQSIPIYESLEAVGFLAAGTLSTDANLAYIGGEKNRIRIIDLDAKAEFAAEALVDQTTETTIQHIIYNAQDKTLCSVRSNQTILTHDLGSLELPIVRRIVGQFDEIIDCTYILDDTKIAIASNSEDVHLFEPLTGNVEVLSEHSDIVIAIDRDFSSNFLVTGSKDNTAKLWNLLTLECVMTFSGHTESLGAVALPRTPNDGALPDFVITGAQDRTLKCWDPATGGKRSKWTIKAHEKDINAIDVSPNDRLVASASQDRLCKLWDQDTGDVVAVLRGHKRGVWTVKFSSFEKVIATGSGDRSVKLWSLNDYTCTKTFEGHTNSVLNCLFLSSGQQIASAGGDGLVKVWTIRTGECETTLDNHEDRVWSLALKSDDQTLVSGGGDSVLNFWRDTTAEVRESAAKAREEVVEKEQTLSNYVQSSDWRNAIALALALDRPGKLLHLLTEVMTARQEPDSITGLHAVDDVLSSLSNAQLLRLLQRLRDWNTNAKTAPVAQSVLNVVLRAYGPDELVAIPGINTILDPLLAFGERHYGRMNALIQETYLVDYTLREMANGM